MSQRIHSGLAHQQRYPSEYLMCVVVGGLHNIVLQLLSPSVMQRVSGRLTLVIDGAPLWPVWRLAFISWAITFFITGLMPSWPINYS